MNTSFSINFLNSFVKIKIPEILRWIFRQSHLTVVEYHPMAIFENVGDIVAYHSSSAHVRDKSHKTIL